MLVRPFLQEGHIQRSFPVLGSASVETWRVMRVWREYECGWPSCDDGQTGRALVFFVSAEEFAIGVREGIQKERSADLEESA